MPGIGNPNAFNPMAGENDPREQTAMAFSQADLYSQLRDVFVAANRNNTAIYTLDPRGLATNEFDINEPVGPQQDQRMLQASTDTLRVIADETDGKAIVARNDLAKGLALALQDSSSYYLIGYTSAMAPIDGKFHPIKVQLSAAARRRGLQVRARKGYWAATAADVVKAEKATATATVAGPDPARPVLQALATIAVSVQSGKYVRTWLGSERGASGKTKMTLVWEALPPNASRRDPAPGRVSLIAATEKGDLVFRGRAPEASGGAVVAGGANALSFEAPPGKLELRMTVEGAGGGVLDQEIRTISVPDLSSAQPTLSTPRVYSVRTPRELQAIAANAMVPGTSRRRRRRRC
jgi:hypothetical protein